jgi:hypothetical protein
MINRLLARWRSASRSTLCFAALAMLVLVALVTHPEGEFTRGGAIHGDGVYHYATLRSLAFDQDFDLTNDYALLGNPYRYGAGPRGLPINRFSIGPAFVWAPFLLIAHVLAWIGTTLGWLDDSLNGSSLLYQRVALFGSSAAALTTVAIAFRQIGGQIGRGAAYFACTALCSATPWFWYAAYQPSYSHAASGFALACFVALCAHGSNAPAQHRRWFVAGLALGFCASIRAQDSVAAIIVVTIPMAIKDRAKQLGVVAIGALIGFAPQMVMWQAIYGRPLLIVQGEGFMLWDASQWDQVLWSTRNGLFAFHPILLFALGCTLFASKRGMLSKLEKAGILVFLAQVYINGAAHDWWGGWAFGGRRFLGLALFFAFFCARMWSSHRRRRIAAVVVLTCCSASNMALMHDYFWRKIEVGRSVDMRRFYTRWLGSWTEPIHRLAGHPGSWPANWIFAARARAEPGAFDRVSGYEVARYKGFEAGRESLDLHRFGVRGFEFPTKRGEGREDRHPYHSKAGPITIVVPMRRAFRGALDFRIAATSGESIDFYLNGNWMKRAELRAGSNRVRLHFSGEESCSGLNYLRAEFRQALRWSQPVVSLAGPHSESPASPKLTTSSQ